MRAAALLLCLAACSDNAAPPPRPQPAPKAQDREPRRVWIDQIHISFKGAKPDIGSVRPAAEARRLAYNLLEKIESGVEFDLLKKKHTDDRDATDAPNGPYVVVNSGVQHVARRDGVPEIPRDVAHPAWGDMAFALEPGEVGVVDYDKKTCPSGYHVMKRLQ